MRVSLGLVASVALAFAAFSSFFAGCANGTSAISAGLDAGGDDDIPPGDDDDDGDDTVGDASVTGQEAGSKADAAASDGASDGSVDSGPTTCAGALALAQYSFDDGPQGWTHGVSDGQGTDWPFDPWTWGTATAGPACPDGSCFGAELTENYAQCQRGYLVSPTLNLATCSGQDLTLTFQHGYSFWNDGTFFDGGVVLVSPDGGANWHTLSASFPGVVSIQESIDAFSCDDGGFEVDQKHGYTGLSAGTALTVQLTIPAALVTSQTLIKFSMGSGVSTPTDDAGTSRLYTSSGWRVDNVGLALATTDAGP